jgi:hypothetical protein
LCYTTTQKIQFQYTYCNPTSVGDWVGLFPSRALFLDRLWKEFIQGKVLECGDGEEQTSCEESDLYQPRIEKQMNSPPITDVGEYRFFLVKKSDYPYEYVAQTAAFRVIEEGQSCDDNNDIAEDSNNDEDEDESSSVFDGFMDIGDDINIEDNDNSNTNDDFATSLGDLIGDLTGDEQLGDQIGDSVGGFITGTVDNVNDIFNGPNDDGDNVIDLPGSGINNGPDEIVVEENSAPSGKGPTTAPSQKSPTSVPTLNRAPSGKGPTTAPSQKSPTSVPTLNRAPTTVPTSPTTAPTPVVTSAGTTWSPT